MPCKSYQLAGAKSIAARLCKPAVVSDFKVNRLAKQLPGIEHRLELREKSVALDLALHQREEQVGTLAKRLGVNLCAAADENCPVTEIVLLAKRVEIADRAHAGARFGTGRPIDSNVLRPITSTCPIVVCLNHSKSFGRSQGIVAALPITRFSDMAAMALKGRAGIIQTAIGALIDGCGS